MRMRLVLCFLMFAFSLAQAQTLSVYKTFGGLLFQRDTLTISAKQVHSLLQENPEAYQQFSLARKNSTVASALGFAGGLLIGVRLAGLLIGSEPEWGFALAGAALIGVGIPFNRAYERHAANAIDTYNQQKSARSSAKADVVVSGSGIGLRLRF